MFTAHIKDDKDNKYFLSLSLTVRLFALSLSMMACTDLTSNTDITDMKDPVMITIMQTGDHNSSLNMDMMLSDQYHSSIDFRDLMAKDQDTTSVMNDQSSSELISCDDHNPCTYNDHYQGNDCQGDPIVCQSRACVEQQCNGTSTCDEILLTNDFCDHGFPSVIECNDMIDNDGDGLIDYPNDVHCINQEDAFEISSQCEFAYSQRYDISQKISVTVDLTQESSIEVQSLECANVIGTPKIVSFSLSQNQNVLFKKLDSNAIHTFVIQAACSQETANLACKVMSSQEELILRLNAGFYSVLLYQMADQVNEAFNFEIETKSEGEACDDEDPCTYDDRSIQGACVGIAITCESSECTTRQCNGTSECQNVQLNRGQCDDEDLCTYNDRCRNGECRGTNLDCTSDLCILRSCTGDSICEEEHLTNQLCNQGQELSECDDLFDNDMDGFIDADDPFCLLENHSFESARCELYDEPIELVSATQTLLIESPLNSSHYSGSCGGRGSETPIAILIEERSNLNIYTTSNPTEDADNFDTILYLREQVCDSNSQEVACDDDGGSSRFSRLQLNNLPVGLYYLFVDNDDDYDLDDFVDENINSPFEAVQLHIEINALRSENCDDEQDNDQDHLIDQADPFCTESHHFEDPYCQHYTRAIQTISTSQELNVLFENTGNHYSGSCGGDGAEVVLAILLTEDSTLSVATTSDSIDSVIYLFEGECDLNQRNVICDDDSGDSFDSRFRTEVLSAGVYYLFIDQYDNDDDDLGALQVNILIEPDSIVPPNRTACNDTLDNDLDGWIDYPDDIHCSSSQDSSEDGLCIYDEPVTVNIQPNVPLSLPLTLNTLDVLPLYCGGSFDQITYSFDITHPATLSVSIQIPNQPPTQNPPQYALELRSEGCDINESTYACTVLPIDTIQNYSHLSPGTYYLVVQHDRGTHLPNALLDLQIEVIATECSDGLDNDMDGRIDLYDAGCVDYMSVSETEVGAVQPQCLDQIDNDNDGFLDYPQDLGCNSAGDLIEAGRCDFGGMSSSDLFISNEVTSFNIDLQHLNTLGLNHVPNLICNIDDEQLTFDGDSIALITVETNTNKIVEIWLEGDSSQNFYTFLLSPTCQFDSSALCGPIISLTSSSDIEDLYQFYLPPGTYSLYINRTHRDEISTSADLPERLRLNFLNFDDFND